MGEQHFCLRWNHHQSTLVKVFDALLQDESLVDVTLYAEGRPMRAHKVVLSACSSYFQEVFANHSVGHPVIILKDVLYSELRALVDYMYRGEVSVSQQQLGSLIRAAESLQVKGLADGSSGAGAGGDDSGGVAAAAAGGGSGIGAADSELLEPMTSMTVPSSGAPTAAPMALGANGAALAPYRTPSQHHYRSLHHQQQQQQQQTTYQRQQQQQQQRHHLNGAVSPVSSHRPAATPSSVPPPAKRRRCPSPVSNTSPAAAAAAAGAVNLAVDTHVSTAAADSDGHNQAPTLSSMLLASRATGVADLSTTAALAAAAVATPPPPPPAAAADNNSSVETVAAAAAAVSAEDDNDDEEEEDDGDGGKQQQTSKVEEVDEDVDTVEDDYERDLEDRSERDGPETNQEAVCEDLSPSTATTATATTISTGLRSAGVTIGNTYTAAKTNLLANIPATITPVPLTTVSAGGDGDAGGGGGVVTNGPPRARVAIHSARRTFSPPATPELDLSMRSTVAASAAAAAAAMAVRASSGYNIKLENDNSGQELVAHDRSDGELDGGSDSETPGPSTLQQQQQPLIMLQTSHPSAASTPGEPMSLSLQPQPPASLLQHGFMKWPMAEATSGDAAFGQSAEPGAAQDAFLQRALSARFQQLLQQQRYDQLLAARGVSPVGMAQAVGAGGPGAVCVLNNNNNNNGGGGGGGGQPLPLMLKRESPTSPGKLYPCDRCGRHYASSGNLKRHIKYECGVEPQFQCPVCKKKFQHRHSVKIHVVSTHKSENPELIKEYLV